MILNNNPIPTNRFVLFRRLDIETAKKGKSVRVNKKYTLYHDSDIKLQSFITAIFTILLMICEFTHHPIKQEITDKKEITVIFSVHFNNLTL